MTRRTNRLRLLGEMTIAKRVLVLGEVALGLLAVYRFYSYWTTGFFVSDEFGYFYDAVHGMIYSDRWFFGWLNIIVFRILGINSVDPFSYFLPFYILFWSGLTLILFYKTMRTLGYDERTTALSLLSSFALISFVLLSLGFLTEPVGLCTTMLGIYCLVRFLKSDTARGMIAFPFLSALAFGAAAGTREPDNAFLIGGFLIVLLTIFARRKGGLKATRYPLRTVLVLAILASLIPTIILLEVPSHIYVQQIAPLASSMASRLLTNPFTPTSPHGNIPFYRSSLLLNTILIFLGGITLGWGPICLMIAVFSFVLILIAAVRRKDLQSRFLLLLCLIGLGSYFVVSYVYAPDPYYFTFQNYSTVIRFSDTALPAYFIAAPAFLSLVSKSRKRIIALAVVAVSVLLVLVPVYEVYAASNINYTSQNPFQLGYRTPAADIRDYIQQHLAGQDVNIVGDPYGWVFTPGVENLHSTQVYALTWTPLIPHVDAANFTAAHWSRFFIYVDDVKYLSQNAPYLLPFLNSTVRQGSVDGSQYTILSRSVLIDGPGFQFVEVELAWQ